MTSEAPSAPLPEPRPTAPEPGKLLMVAPRRGKPPKHLADLTLAERMAAVKELGEKPFRGRQLSVHYFERLAELDAKNPDSAAALTDLPATSRQPLLDALLPNLIHPVRELVCDDGATIKTVWRLFDGALVESVLMRYPDRATVCVSSQAGCGMNCPFCATGQAGLTRNLSTAEIVEQVRTAARHMRTAAPLGRSTEGAPLGEEAEEGQAGRVSNVVFMGMGEALANYKAAIGAIRRLTDPAPEGLGMSARGITMSTVGLVPAIDKLAAEGIPVTLALSLHAPDDELRDELVPINTRWKVGETLDAARRYFDATGRRVSIEYALIKDINDHEWRGDMLGRELNKRGKGWVHVNPIPLNPTPGSKWTASTRRAQNAFVNALRERGVPTTVRDTRGQEIDGACGQLAATV
ncbi:23S rRNA (adenine(2503)-C(2))-methyltransferase RlmN [Kineosporia sp. NBRC 101731]|uniref:23S rRNA (adenine(2503)-C(2))-methyltransferase RlmN n=1 Tax=Kineosporia sp. NBRC 101731 TaxID=3032199 RepID=UPI0024A3CB2B|nr:23S rRNA (adenine(2503)-C(2))-methyltransferase RlmN [Kineosporia sp. NBRC 101731]GLY30194.1 putative dual-specificity RNA methyltransferase RlmN [Kineosporia sp. NBRC 101731]